MFFGWGVYGLYWCYGLVFFVWCYLLLFVLGMVYYIFFWYGDIIGLYVVIVLGLLLVVWLCVWGLFVVGGVLGGWWLFKIFVVVWSLVLIE